MYDVIIRGTAVDYMHCVCEGVIDQHLLISRWLDKSNSKQGFYLGSKVEEISKELMAITPTCEITRTPRRLGDIKDWKSETICTLRLAKLRINMHFLSTNL